MSHNNLLAQTLSTGFQCSSAQGIRATQKRPIALSLISALSLTPLCSMAETEITLEPVIVTGTILDGTTSPSYKSITIEVGKTTQRQLDVPQSTTVIPDQLIKDQQATTVKEALRNVAGLTFNAGEGGRSGDNITLRGYAAATDLYLDGLRDNGQYNRDTFNLEQIEALRGASSMLFGRGSTGGVINQVSKRAHLKDQLDTEVLVGTTGSVRTSADLNRKLSETSAVRLNVLADHTDNGRTAYSNRIGIAPNLKLGIGTETELEFALYHAQEDNLPDYGVPYFNGKPLDVPADRFFGMTNQDYERTQTSTLTQTIKHEFNEELTIKNTLRLAHYRRDLNPSAPRLVGTPAVITDTTPLRRSHPGREGTDTLLINQTDLHALFDTGTLSHDLLAGLELTQEHSFAQRWRDKAALPNTTVGNPDTTPMIPAREYTGSTTFKAASAGIYFQDLISLTSNWKVLTGARFDWLSSNYLTRTFTGTPSSVVRDRTDRQWSYRAGLLYEPSENSTYYLSAGTSFNPSGETYALDARGTNTPPELNRNFEIGAKWSLGNGDYSLRAALFRTEKTNERNTDPLVNNVYLLSGKRHTEGLELELSGRLTPKWNLFASGAWMHSNIDRTNVSTQLNKRALNTPAYTFSLWSTYDIAPGWQIGGGVSTVGSRYTSLNNTTQLPAYTRWDAMIKYSAQKYELQLNLNNLANTRYYDGLYAGHTTLGTQRTAELTFRYHFD